MTRRNKIYKHELFNSVESCKDHLIAQGILEKNTICLKCGSISELIVYREKSSERLIYRCKKDKCQSKTSLFKDNRWSIDEFLFLVYLLLIRESYGQIKLLNQASNSKIASTKKLLRSYFKYKNRNSILIGGLGVKVEVDETVLCRRGIIRNPTSSDDYMKDTVWILGIIDTNNKDNFFVARIEDRTSVTISRTLEDKIGIGSVLASDGWPSYPSVAKNLSLKHVVVNHSEGFINNEGTHTNNIENLWSCMKSEMSREHGVKREDIDLWLEEFMFRRRFIDESSFESVKGVLYEFIKFLLK